MCSDSVATDTDTDGLSSTDAGEDICTTYVDFDDFTSSSSEDETVTDHKPASVRLPEGAATTCVFSVMTLLHFRAAVCDEDEENLVHYSTMDKSEMPTACAKSPSKMRTSPTSPMAAGDSWRASPTLKASPSPAAMADSWRQALPESAANSWVVQQRNRATEDDDANVVRTLRSILNKLTVEKFDSLFEQLATCGLKCPSHISILMREVFEKATTQHHFIPMYADLCVKLEKDPRIAAVVEEADLPNNFRRLLLNQCQKVFEQVLESKSDEVDIDEEIVFRRKQQALGNMKLIGRLLVHGMLSADLFPECCEELLRKHTQCPEALEALVALMMVAGSKFDHRAWQYYQRLETIIADMRALTKDKSVLPRLRFIIRDVLDARDARWPSSPSGGKMPTTLEGVRIAAATEALQNEDRLLPEDNSSGGTGISGSPKAHPWSLKSQEGSKEDTKLGGKNSRKKAVDSQKEEARSAPNVSTSTPKEDFNVVTWRRTLASIFADLASDKNIPAAVQRVRLQQVPAEVQAEQFVDILTRVVEERRGAVRRCELAFLAGLAAAEESAFSRDECIVGIGKFFKEVYPDLCNEVHRLPAIMKSEFMPTVANVFPTADLNKVVPAAMRK
jgi:hypothetical protein